MLKDDATREPVHEVTEGPYYKEGSPERTNIVENGTFGEILVVKGSVLDIKGNPIAGARIDFWQADGKGNYDNSGYNLRGHQYTDNTGSYHLETVIPALYGPRTPHIHVKVRANPQSQVVTSQLFFPDQNSNEKDTIFDPALLMDVLPHVFKHG